MSASVFSVSLISSVSFGTYRNFLCNICKLRYGSADVKPSKLDVSLAGGAAGAVRVGEQPSRTAQPGVLFADTRGWKSGDVFCWGLSGMLACFLMGSCSATLAKTKQNSKEEKQPRQQTFPVALIAGLCKKDVSRCAKHGLVFWQGQKDLAGHSGLPVSITFLQKGCKKGQKGNFLPTVLWGWGQKELSPRRINVCPQRAVPWCGAALEQFPVGRWMFVGICRHQDPHCPGRKHTQSQAGGGNPGVR